MRPRQKAGEKLMEFMIVLLYGPCFNEAPAKSRGKARILITYHDKYRMLQ